MNVEGEDPRIYDDTGQVQGVRNSLAPIWQARKPWLPGMWKRNLGTTTAYDENDAGPQIMIVDVAWYNNKVDDLFSLIKDFHPTTYFNKIGLLLCHSHIELRLIVRLRLI